MCFISFIVSGSLVGSPVMDISTAIRENGSFTGVKYAEGNKWNKNAYQKCKRGKNRILWMAMC
jgi:hypothetical protein